MIIQNIKNQKGFNSEKQLVIVVQLEILQTIVGFFIGLIFAFYFNFEIMTLGIIIFVIFLILMTISFIQPALLRIIFFFIGISVGMFVYYLLNIIDFIPTFS